MPILRRLPYSISLHVNPDHLRLTAIHKQPIWKRPDIRKGNTVHSGRGSVAASVVKQRAFIEGAGLSSPQDDTETPVLYTHTLCPYAHRAWLAFLEKVPGRLLNALFDMGVLDVGCL